MYINIEKILKTKVKFVLVRMMPFGLATTLLVGCGSMKNNTQKEENYIGYSNISLGLNFKVKDENFVILNIGDSIKNGVNFLEEKIHYCNEHNISFGMIITPSSFDINVIYDNIEMVKGIIDNYKIDFPIYFNIDPIIESNDIDSDMKSNIIKTFLDKCIVNGMYVGVYGKDINLVYLKKYCRISEYDAFVVMDKDKEKIEYDGEYNLYQDEKGKIFSKTDLAEVIEKNKLNSDNKFVLDAVYVVGKNDSLLEIAMKYNISINDLLKYNEMKEKDFKDGVVIKIPTHYNKILSNSSVNNNYKRLEAPILGCDISYSQDSINWNEVKDNFDFIILRSCFGGTKDVTFDKNAMECSLNNIPFGVYCFNDCRGIDYKDNEMFINSLTEQADSCLEIIANKNVIYPVYFDLEVYEGEDFDKIYSREQIKIMLDLWYEKISDAGYIPGLYCNRSTYKYISNCYDTSDFEIWIAGGDAYDYDISFEEIEAPIKDNYLYDGQMYVVDMFQTNQYVTGAGAENNEGYLDINYSFVDYNNVILTEEDELKYNMSYKNVKRNKFRFSAKLFGGLAIGGSVLSLGYILNKEKLKGKKRNRKK